jgi:HisJ family histidinol phosphate phosphatase
MTPMTDPLCRADHHVHTLESGHSAPDMVMADVLRAAAEAGMERVAIVEHIPPVQPDVHEAVIAGDPVLTAVGDEVLATVRAAVDEAGAPESLDVLVGAEIDADPHHRDGRLLYEPGAAASYVLGSTHYLPGGRGFWKVRKSWSDRERRRIFEEWVAWTAALAANPVVDVLGHTGALPAVNRIFDAFEGWVLEGFERILAACAEHATAIELNELLAIKLDARQRETYPEVIRMARRHGVKLSPGSDAHSLGNVGRYDFARWLAAEAGIAPEDMYNPLPCGGRCDR